MELPRDKVEIYADGRVNTVNAARYLGCSAKTLAHLRCSGRGPAFIKRGRVYYYVADLADWLNRNGRHQSTAQARLSVGAQQTVQGGGPERRRAKNG